MPRSLFLIAMPILFAILGAWLGAMLQHGGEWLFGALIGFLFGRDLVQRRKLKEEIEALRQQMAGLEMRPGVPERPTPLAAPVPSPRAEAAQAAPIVPPVAPPVAAPLVAAPAAKASVPQEGADTVQGPEPEIAPPAQAAPPPSVTPPRPPAAPRAPAVPLRDRLPAPLRDAIFGGNTVVKVGVLLLFLGLAFLLRYVAARTTVPVEWRYVGVGLGGLALLALGWRLRDARRGPSGYGLILQGAGIGVLYLSLLAAMKLHQLLPSGLGFGLMAAVAVLGAALAVLQNAPWLALVSAAEGFAAPVLISTGGGNPVAMFSYLALLDLGIVLVAWHKAWRALNVLGFVATFGIAGAWASRSYESVLYAPVQAFLLLFFLMFSAVGVLFARRALALGGTPPEGLSERARWALEQTGRVDSALVFGVPLVGYGLQYALTLEWTYGPAWSAFGLALFYLLLGGALLRRAAPRFALLGEAYVIVSAIFTTLTVPLALEGEWTGATWAIEAAGMYWLGWRQLRPYARALALTALPWLLCKPLWASAATAWLGLGLLRLAHAQGLPALTRCAGLIQALAVIGWAGTLQRNQQEVLDQGWQGALAALLIAAAVLGGAGLSVRAKLRALGQRAPRWTMGEHAGLLVGLGLLALVWLYAMPPQRAAWIWAPMGLCALALGLRLAQPALMLGAVLLQLGAAVAALHFGADAWSPSAPGADPTWLTPLLLSLGALWIGDRLRAEVLQLRPGNAWLTTRALHWAPVLWFLLCWSQLLPPLIHAQLAQRQLLSFEPAWLLGWLLLSSVLIEALASWRDGFELGRSNWLSVPAWALVALARIDTTPFAFGGAWVWPALAVWHVLLLRRQPRWWDPAALKPLHVLGFYLFLGLAAWELQSRLATLGEPGSAWPVLGWMLMPTLAVFALSRWRERWPVSEFRSLYWNVCALPVALYLALWMLGANLSAGAAAPLPYLPLLNPLEIGIALTLLALAALWHHRPAGSWEALARLWPPALGLAAWLFVTGAVLRACHHHGGLPWSGDALWDAKLAQASLSVAWTLMGVGLMLVAQRLRRRSVWVAGAGLLALVVAKLFFVELADHDGVYRIVSFIVVGLLLLAVGYFAPVPPAEAETRPEGSP